MSLVFQHSDGPGEYRFNCHIKYILSDKTRRACLDPFQNCQAKQISEKKKIYKRRIDVVTIFCFSKMFVEKRLFEVLIFFCRKSKAKHSPPRYRVCHSYYILSITPVPFFFSRFLHSCLPCMSYFCFIRIARTTRHHLPFSLP